LARGLVGSISRSELHHGISLACPEHLGRLQGSLDCSLSPASSHKVSRGREENFHVIDKNLEISSSDSLESREDANLGNVNSLPLRSFNKVHC
jgi:hypothetical protein